PKTLQRSVQSMKKASVRVPSPTKTQRDPPKMSPAPGIRKSASIGHLRQPGSKRWQ
ncbi:hypothetical protein HN51_035872, partial [Arachis hypogaea]